MSSKYGNLPDIDTAQDVYQTSDSPEPGAQPNRSSDNDDGEGEEPVKPAPQEKENEDIDRNGLKPGEAADRFRIASEADGSHADFSDTLRRPRRRAQLYPPPSTLETSTYELYPVPYGYASGSGTASGSSPFSELNGDRERETPVARLRRLRFEASQLEEELEAHAASALDATSSSADAGAPSEKLPRSRDDEVPPLELLSQLRALRADLSRLDAQAPDSSAAATGKAAWERDARVLISRLGLAASGAEGAARTTTSKEQVETEGNQSGASSGARTSDAVVNLDGRLAELEGFVGVKEMMLDESKPINRPLLSTIQRLEHQVQLLTVPRALDGISKRIKPLMTELERVHDARRKIANSTGAAPSSGSTAAAAAAASSAPGTNDAEGGEAGRGAAGEGLSADALRRIDSLFALQGRIEPLLPLAPALLARLRTLSDLHSSASSFASSINSLGKEGAKLDSARTEMDTLLQSVQESLKENAKTTEGNMSALERRVEALVARIGKLGA